MPRFTARTLLLALGLGSLAACSGDLASPAAPVSDGLTPEATAEAARPEAPGLQRGAVIVVLRESAGDPAAFARRVVGGFGGEVLHTYRNALQGFAAVLPPQAIEALQRNPNVALVEADGPVSISTTQSNATWGLDRIDQRDLPLNGSYTYPDGGGAGVRAYILDTGILGNHVDFGGRVTGGFTAISDGRGSTDCNGHGTHVAGTVGGTTWGVAKSVTLVPVRVLGCDGGGTISGVIAGVDWVAGQTHRPAVANMSLGGGASTSLDQAVRNAVSQGITFVVAAGNSNKDACNYSPAREASALTVGATNSSDSRASFSNFGRCLDLFAPGVSIMAPWHTSTTATNTISGTSMAAPHVAGVAALYLAANTSATPSQVETGILGNASTGKVSSAGRNSPNLLLYMGFLNVGGETPPPANQAPTASFTFSCTDLACTFDGSGSSDPEGSTLTYAWNFGDGTSGSGVNALRTYASAGSYTVILTVTGNGELTGTDSKSVTVTAPVAGDPPAPVLSGVVRTTGPNRRGDLSWTGATGAVNVLRDGTVIASNVTGSSYSDSMGRARGTFTYKVCYTAATSVCSNDLTLTY
jgi:serine protease